MCDYKPDGHFCTPHAAVRDSSDRPGLLVCTPTADHNRISLVGRWGTGHRRLLVILVDLPAADRTLVASGIGLPSSDGFPYIQLILSRRCPLGGTVSSEIRLLHYGAYRTNMRHVIPFFAQA